MWVVNPESKQESNEWKNMEEHPISLLLLYKIAI
jgi:hypothetical protein